MDVKMRPRLAWRGAFFEKGGKRREEETLREKRKAPDGEGDGQDEVFDFDVLSWLATDSFRRAAERPV